MGFNWLYVLLNISNHFFILFSNSTYFFGFFFLVNRKAFTKPFNKVRRYKINLENSAAFLYASRKHVEEEGIETISFQIALKLPWNKLRDTEVSSRYNENFKILKREIKLN